MQRVSSDNNNGFSRRDALKRMGLLMAGVASLGMGPLTSCREEAKKRIILYFTGTGNSLYIARQLADENTELASSANGKDPFERGTLMPDNPNFTGKAWLQGYVAPEDGFGCAVSNVTFAPGCRNSWHSHKGGQILLCTSGKGYYQEKGKPIQLLLPGDVVKIAPDVVHWHGAAPDSEFTHMAIGTQLDKGGVTWLSPVTDEEYNSYKGE